MPGLINVDFADVKTLLSGAGTVLMGIGGGRGDNLAEDASSVPPIPRCWPAGSRRHHLLINITGSSDLTLHDADQIVEKISQATEVEDVNVLFGVTYDDDAADEVRVTVIAAGFNQTPQVRLIKPSGPRGIAGQQNFDPGNYDIPAFLRYNPENDED